MHITQHRRDLVQQRIFGILAVELPAITSHLSFLSSSSLPPTTSAFSRLLSYSAVRAFARRGGGVYISPAPTVNATTVLPLSKPACASRKVNQLETEMYC